MHPLLSHEGRSEDEMRGRSRAVVAGGLGLFAAAAVGCGLIAGLGDFRDAPASTGTGGGTSTGTGTGGHRACVTALDCPGIASCTKDGACQDAVVWSRRYGDAADQVLSSLSADSKGNVVIAGHFRGAIDFGSGE